jgi:hypothetical protein
VSCICPGAFLDGSDPVSYFCFHKVRKKIYPQLFHFFGAQEPRRTDQFFLHGFYQTLLLKNIALMITITKKIMQAFGIRPDVSSCRKGAAKHFFLHQRVFVKYLSGLLMISCFVLLSSSDTYAQSAAGSWELLQEKNGVKVFKMTKALHDNVNDFHAEYVLLKFENTNTTSVNISWFNELHYDGTCRTCGAVDEYTYEISLAAGAVKEGKAAVGKKDGLRIFSRFLNLDKSELTDFAVKSFEVRP